MKISGFFYAVVLGLCVFPFIAHSASGIKGPRFIVPECFKELVPQEGYEPYKYSFNVEGKSKFRDYAFSNENYKRCHINAIKEHQQLLIFANLSYDIGPTKVDVKNGILPVINRLTGESSNEVTIGLSSESEREIPEGYTGTSYYSKCGSGFSAVKFVPDDQSACIFSIAGTNEGLDAWVDFGLGKRQIKGLPQQELISDVIKCVAESKKVIFTGHSLGGLMAQIGAYVSQEYLYSQENYTDDINLVTWNAPGGLDLINRDIEGDITEAQSKHGFRDNDVILLKKDILTSINQTHYNLDSDSVSWLGVHYGLVLELPYEEFKFITGHFGANIEKTFAKKITESDYLVETYDNQRSSIKRFVLEGIGDALAFVGSTIEVDFIWEWAQNRKFKKHPICKKLDEVVVYDLNLTKDSVRSKPYSSAR